MKTHGITEYGYQNRYLRYSEKLKRAMKNRTKELEEAHAELLRKNNELSILLTVSRSLLKSKDIHELLDKTVRGAVTMVPSEAGVLLLTNPDSGLIELASFHNIESLLIGDVHQPSGQLHFGFDDSFISRDDPKIKSITSLLALSNLLNSDRYYDYENCMPGGVRNILTVLLSGMDRVLGVIYLINRLYGDYTEEDAGFLLAFANEAAVTIENLKIHASLLEKEKEVQVQRRLATIGEMSAQIAHEIRNPLQKILTGVEYIRDYCEPGNKNVIDVVTNGVSSINKIISKMVEFGRNTSLSLKSVDINEIVEDVLSGSKPRLASIEVVRDFPDKGKLEVDPVRLRQALQNIIDNAIDAMPGGGRMKVSMRFLCGDENRPSKRVCTEIVPPPKLEIKVSDSGKGMDTEAIGKLFTPFYTTKFNGSGLGMAMVKKIVDLHKGEISVNSQAGAGTEVTIRLPLIPDSNQYIKF